MGQSKEQKFQARLLATFKVEAEEHVKAISALLISFEEGTEEASYHVDLESIYRELHSLKGAARAVGINTIEVICQILEDLFNTLKHESGKLDRSAFNILHNAVDFLRSISNAYDSSVSNTPEGVDLLLQQIKEIESVFKASGDDSHPTINLNQDVQDPIGMSVLPTSSRTEDTIRIKTAKLKSVLHHSEELIPLKQMLIHHSRQLDEVQLELDTLIERLSKPYHKEANLQVMNERIQQDPLSNTREMLVQSISNFKNDTKTSSQIINRLMEGIRSLVLMPFNSMLELFPKMVRALSQEQGKKVSLKVTGSELEVDKRILELLKDPLTHILRNCIDHGIELPADRISLGKKEEGEIHIDISTTTGSQLEIYISDDGCGINIPDLCKRAVSKGLVSAETVEAISQEEQLELAFLSGLSTSDMLTEISGRGLGMSIVRDKVENAGGSVSLKSEDRKGTSLLIKLPLSYGTYSGIRVLNGNHEYVLPIKYVENVIRIKLKEIKTFGGRKVLPLKGDSISLEHLDHILQLNRGPGTLDDELLPVLILKTGSRRLALLVHEILGEEEILVQGFPEPLKNVRNFEGITLLGSGKLVPVLSVNDLVRSVEHGTVAPSANSELKNSKKKKPSIAIAEDSMTARMLLKDILESAGYAVKAAIDGAEALAILQESKFDLLVSDIEMPRMDGFELTERIRKDQTLRELPIILVTALKSREDREKGMQAGANAYIEKGKFDPEQLLKVIEQLID